jgi:hypothetical protein
MVAWHEVPGNGHARLPSFCPFGTKSLVSFIFGSVPTFGDIGMPVPNDWLHILRRAGVQSLAWIGLLLLIRSALILLHLSAK